MNCAELEQHAVDFLYGELDADTRAALEAHAAGCSACHGQLEAWQATLRSTRAVLQGALLEPAPERIRHALLNAASRHVGTQPSFWTRMRHWLTRPWLVPILAGAAALLLFVRTRPDAPAAAPGAPAAQHEDEASARSSAPDPAGSEFAVPPTATGERETTALERRPHAKSAARPSDERDEAMNAAAPSRRRDDARPPAPRETEAKAEVASADESLAADKMAPAPAVAAAPNAPRRAAKRAQRTDVTLLESDPRAGAAMEEHLQALPSPPVSALDARGSAAAARPPNRALQSERAPQLAAEPQAAASGAAQPPAARSAASPPQPTSAPTLVERVERAERAFREQRWHVAAETYLELLRRYPEHRDVARWRQRLQRARAEIAAQPATPTTER